MIIPCGFFPVRIDILGESSTNAYGSRALCNFCFSEGHAVDNCPRKGRHERSIAKLHSNPQTDKIFLILKCLDGYRQPSLL